MQVSARIATLTLVGVVTFMCVDVVHAQEAPDDDAALSRAVVLFEESENAYNAGRFAAAVDLLRRAYELHPDATLLFNLARALEGMGDLDGAIESYQRYVDEAPDAPDRGAIEGRLDTLRQQRDRLDEDDSTEEEAEPEEDLHEPADAGGSAVSAPPWIVAGIGAAIAGTGAVFGAMSQSKGDEAAAEPVQVTADELHSEAETFATLANVMFIVGGVAVLGGVVWGVLTLGGGDGGEEEVSAAVGPGGVLVSGRF